MADTKTSAETAASALDGTELIRGVQGGANVKMTPAQIKTYAAGLVLLGTFNPSAVNAQAITSLLSSVYDDYIFVCENLIPSASNALFEMQFSTDNGATWLTGITDYINSYSSISSTNSTGAGNGAGGWNKDWFSMVTSGAFNDANGGWCGSISLMGANTGNFKSILSEFGYYNSATLFFAGTGGGRVKTTSVINAVRIVSGVGSGTTYSGTIKVYGIKK